jgi:hypothetical protein
MQPAIESSYSMRWWKPDGGTAKLTGAIRQDVDETPGQPVQAPPI